MATPTDHTSFTVDDSAIVLIDHQVGTIGWAGELTSQDERPGQDVGPHAGALRQERRNTRGLDERPGRPAAGADSPKFKEILPEEYEARIQRKGVINACDDAAFAEAVRGTGKRNFVAAGVTTDVCLVPPALSAKAEGFEVVVLLDISAATTKIAALNSRDLLHAAGIPLLTVIPMITNMLGDFNVPAAAGLYEAMEAEGVFDAFARGNLR